MFCVLGRWKEQKAWTELLNERMNVLGPKESISTSTIVDLLSQVW